MILGKGQLPHNVINGKAGWRRFNLTKCELDGCNNFICSLGNKPKYICKNHQHRRGGHRLEEFKHLKRVSTSIKTRPHFQYSKVVTQRGGEDNRPRI